MNKEEIEAIAAEIDVHDVEEFEDAYVRKIGVRKSLREFPDGACVFFDTETRKCQIYRVRPRQCRTWPFWDSNLRTPKAWARTCSICPGSGSGELHSIEEIEQKRTVMRL